MLAQTEALGLGLIEVRGVRISPVVESSWVWNPARDWMLVPGVPLARAGWWPVHGCSGGWAGRPG